MLLSKLSQRRCSTTPFLVSFCGAVLIALIGLVGCSSTDGRGLSMNRMLGAIQRDTDRDTDDAPDEQRPARRSRTEDAKTSERTLAREQKASASPTTSPNVSHSATNHAPPVSNSSRLTPPPAPTPAPGYSATLSAAAARSAVTSNAPVPPPATTTHSAAIQPPPPPEPRIPAALRKKTVAESSDAPKSDLVPDSAPNDSPEIALLLADLRKAESVDGDKCEKIVSELRKMDAAADPAFYKSMVAFARTVLLPPPPKTNDNQHISQHETPAITPVAAAEEKPPQPATPPPRPLSPSTVAIVPQDTTATISDPTEPNKSVTLASPATTLTISDTSPAASQPEPQTNAPATPRSATTTPNSLPNAVFVPRGGGSGASESPVVPVSYNSGGGSANSGAARDGDWQQLVQQASQVLKAKATTTQDEVRLRFLALALGNQTEASRTIDGIDPATRSFWASELLGLSVILDERSLPDASSRNAAAIYHLARAQNELRKECPLKIQQMRFVEKWYGFGTYTTLPGDFDAGATASLYLELENNCVRESPLGFNTRSAAAYVLLDGAGTVVARVENIAAEETSQSRRRDSCLLIPIAIPKTISPGPYQLKITVTDLNHDKLQYAIEQVPLRIRTSSRGGGE